MRVHERRCDSIQRRKRSMMACARQYVKESVRKRVFERES